MCHACSQLELANQSLKMSHGVNAWCAFVVGVMHRCAHVVGCDDSFSALPWGKSWCAWPVVGCDDFPGDGSCLNISGGQGWVGFALTVGFGRI